MTTSRGGGGGAAGRAGRAGAGVTGVATRSGSATVIGAFDSDSPTRGRAGGPSIGVTAGVGDRVYSAGSASRNRNAPHPEQTSASGGHLVWQIGHVGIAGSTRASGCRPSPVGAA